MLQGEELSTLQFGNILKREREGERERERGGGQITLNPCKVYSHWDREETQVFKPSLMFAAQSTVSVEYANCIPAVYPQGVSLTLNKTVLGDEALRWKH